MSERPSEQEKFIQQIAEPGSGGTHAREAARAKLDALLIKDLTASLGQLGGELLQTRKQMAESSVAASRHQRALVAWTVVLSLATIAYAVAAFLPFSWPLFATSTSGERMWVLWGRDSDGKTWTPRDTFAKEKLCREALFDLKDDLRRRARELRRPDLARQDYFECWPDTVDPREPKGGTR